MAMESSSKRMECLLKIDSPKSGWVKSLENLLKNISDVNFTINKRNKTVYIYGKIDPQAIVEKITKIGQRGEIVWSNQGEGKKPRKNRKDDLMEQCYSSRFMNAPPYGIPNNYHHQKCYYPPIWMYQHPPYHQNVVPPPPYIHQFHPQPPPPPPYEVKQTELAAKSFPPTPPPPKTFVMGDLSCMIM